MEKDLALLIASKDDSIKTSSEFMRKANEIALSDGKGDKIFPQIDIVFASFTDYVKETANQREKDLLIISEFLTKCWQTLHIDIQIMNKSLNENEKNHLISLKESLNNLGLTHLLTEGLNKKTLKFFNNLSINNEIKTPKKKM